MKITNFLLFFLFLLFTTFVNAEEECIFDKYLEVSGDFVKINCITEDITAKEKTNIFIRVKDSGITVVDLQRDLPKDFKEISKNPLIYKLNQSNNTAHYAFELLVQGKGFWLLDIFYINSKEWDLYYGNKIPPPSPPKNRRPKWVCQNKFVINKKIMIDLSKCFIDEDNDTLIFSFISTEADNIKVIIENDIAEIIPDDLFVGNGTVVFKADDKKSTPLDKKVTLIVPNKSKPYVRILTLIYEIWTKYKNIIIPIFIVIVLIILYLIGGPKLIKEIFNETKWGKKIKKFYKIIKPYLKK